ncbi:hypothetical protein BJ138DRAFT_1174269 [Hygrophoropsis aurantiaca]|uniref:Uncharacterized protein n=1 Tax=Hygrophoropsis aurantiaca TaxID=72124 RepID=A0ACB8A4F4_9AGAM|nr:hypothetical protein BJ138DRAFT_1174269 [Hygrophoropsis aurantiaca]
MSTEDSPQDIVQQDAKMQDSQLLSQPTEMATETKKRPRIDLNVQPGERKRGKSMFGLVLGTLNKAKIEDKERNASEAAKKRQMIDQRLQAKLRKETDSVRRAEEAKKDKTAANRKEEDLQLKDSIHKLRRTRFPQLANFLLTSDRIPSDDSSTPETNDPLAPPHRSHPPPLYYLPVILTPSQEAFLIRRKAEMSEAAEKEWQSFCEERTAGIEEIKTLRQRVAEEESRKKQDKEIVKDEEGEDKRDKEMAVEGEPKFIDTKSESETNVAPGPPADMDVDDSPAKDNKDISADLGRKEDSVPMQADDDDAVEY